MVMVAVVERQDGDGQPVAPVKSVQAAALPSTVLSVTMVSLSAAVVRLTVKRDAGVAALVAGSAAGGNGNRGLVLCVGDAGGAGRRRWSRAPRRRRRGRPLSSTP